MANPGIGGLSALICGVDPDKELFLRPLVARSSQHLEEEHFIMQPQSSGTICPVKYLALTHSRVLNATLKHIFLNKLLICKYYIFNSSNIYCVLCNYYFYYYYLSIYLSLILNACKFHLFLIILSNCKAHLIMFGMESALYKF